MKEREADPGLVGAVDSHDIALRPIGGGKAGRSVGNRRIQGLDLVDDPLQDAAIPPRRTAVAGDAVAGVPLPAVDLPGGLGLAAIGEICFRFR